MEKSISIVIPAYNEGLELEKTINDVDNIAKSVFSDYEILLFDDCSTDETGKIADKLALKNRKIRVFHNKQNMNMGYNFRMGIKNASKKYVMLLSGPDSVSLESIKGFLMEVGKGTNVSSYIANQDIRPGYRQTISYLVTSVLNLLFGLRLKYYFGMQAYEIELIKNIKITTNSFGASAELLVRSIKAGIPHRQIPYYVRRTTGTSTTAFRFRNVAGIIWMAIRVFFETNFGKQRKLK